MSNLKNFDKTEQKEMKSKDYYNRRKRQQEDSAKIFTIATIGFVLTIIAIRIYEIIVKL